MTKSNWKASEIQNLKGKVAIVTGANSGIGFITALELAKHDAKVYLACRSKSKGLKALKCIKERYSQANVVFGKLDLSSLESVHEFTNFVLSRESKIDLLVNNAGIMAIPELGLTKDGFEMQMGTNHLGHFALTGLILPLLAKSPEGRVVNVTSNRHRTNGTKFDLENLDYSKGGYEKWKAYGDSKLANLLFIKELDKRVQKAGLHITASASHPGLASTNLIHSGVAAKGTVLGIIMDLVTPFLFQSEAMGALPSLYAATSEKIIRNGYYGPDGKDEKKGYPKLVSSSELANDDNFARELWETSEKLTGVKFGI